MHPATDNNVIIARCAALGLSLAQVQRLAGADHSSDDLASVLGLDPENLVPLKPRRWLWMAAQTCSVSYRKPLTPDELMDVLATGNLPSDVVSTFMHFLDEAPLPVVVMAVEQASHQSGVPIAQIWRHVDGIAAALASARLRSLAA